MSTQDTPRPSADTASSSDARSRVERLQSLPVGWAAILIIGAGVITAVAVTLFGALNYGAAGFSAAVLLVGTLLGLAAWDLLVALLVKKHAPSLALPDRITLGLPRQVVPFLSPIAFLVGLLIGHQVWH